MRLVEEREDKRLRWQWQISFNRKETDMKSDITIIPSGNYHILIKGLKQNDIIRIYGTSGVLALQKQAKSETEQLRLTSKWNCSRRGNARRKTDSRKEDSP